MGNIGSIPEDAHIIIWVDNIMGSGVRVTARGVPHGGQILVVDSIPQYVYIKGRYS